MVSIDKGILNPGIYYATPNPSLTGKCPLTPPCRRGQEAQYEMIIRFREAPSCGGGFTRKISSLQGEVACFRVSQYLLPIFESVGWALKIWQVCLHMSDS